MRIYSCQQTSNSSEFHVSAFSKSPNFLQHRFRTATRTLKSLGEAARPENYSHSPGNVEASVCLDRRFPRLVELGEFPQQTLERRHSHFVRLVVCKHCKQEDLQQMSKLLPKTRLTQAALLCLNNVVTSTYTAYPYPNTRLVHQGKGTVYPR